MRVVAEIQCSRDIYIFNVLILLCIRGTKSSGVLADGCLARH
jgi:hypothetical protein